uniref:AB hydrolase-1 domain-containing protein n=1 Tax=Aegilops tauschii subsp. strangulata TaxID=200361 RepID=A0A453D916_AEGTS
VSTSTLCFLRNCMLPETREQLPFILQMMLFCVHTISTSVAVYHQYLQVRNLHLNPILFDRYVLKSEKADVYRLPYLSSGAPGFALLEAARKANFQDVLSRISAGFSSNSWDKPILLAWGESDKYLPLSIAEEFKKNNPSVVKLKPIEGAGHMPQEDWPEKVVAALNSFLY